MPNTRPNHTQNALARRTPTEALDFAEDFARLSAEDRKRRAAEALRDAFLPDPEDPARVAARETLAALVRSYTLTFGRKGLRVSRNTLEQYDRGLFALLAWCEAAALKPHQLDRQGALRYTRHLEALGLQPASINVRLSGARTFVAALAWCGMMAADPFAKVGVSDPTPAWEKRRPYTEAELDRLLAAGDAWERALVLVGADAGLRASEVVALDRADVDLPGRLLTVKSGKGQKQRTLPLSQKAAEALAALVPAPEGRVFAFTRRRADQILRSLCERAGVTCRGMHALRHRFGTRAAVKIGLLGTARLMGHASTRPTEGYAHANLEDFRAGIDALGEARTPATVAA